MSNAERIAITRKEEFGYDEFNENNFVVPKKTVTVMVKGTVKVFKPKEV